MTTMNPFRTMLFPTIVIALYTQWDAVVYSYEAKWQNVTDGELFVSCPMQMQMYVPNMIHVQTTMRNIHIRLATHPDMTSDWIEPDETYETFITVEGLYEAHIPYYVPFYDPNVSSEHWHQLHVLILLCPENSCPNDKIKSVELQYTVNPFSLLILGELMKSEYSPGEVIRGRFVALTSQDTWYVANKIKAPEYYLERLSDYFKKAVHRLDIMNPYSQDFRCSSLKLVRPDQLVWRTWRDLNATGVVHFNEALESNAMSGVWSIEIQCLNQQKKIFFKVRNPATIPFLTYQRPPSKVTIDSPVIQTRVCARHHSGRFINGEVAIMICVCEKQYEIDVPTTKTKAEQLFSRQYCPAHFDSEAQKCAVRRKTLHRKYCQSFEISTMQFAFGHSSNLHGKLYILFCHQVTSKEHKDKVTKCDYSLPVSSRQANLRLDLDYAYRSGLPINVVATMVHPGLKTLAGHRIEVEIAQLPAACAFAKSIPSEPNAFVTYFARLEGNTSSSGRAVFTFPPVRGTPFLQVRALIREFSEEKFIHMGADHLRDGLTAEKILKPWPSSSGALLQVWPGEQGYLRASCRGGPLPVKLISNRPLKSRSIWLEGVFSGLHLVQRFPPVTGLVSSNELSEADPTNENSDECENQDDNIHGHYKCAKPDSDEIICNEGWEGNDCLDAVCSRNCHPAGSWCIEPGQCQCKRQWTGDKCDQCIVCPPNHCSTINYTPCVCEMPSANYTCAALKTVKQRRRPLTSPPRRTMYERTVNVTVIDRYFTGAYVIFYFYEPYRNGKVERISAGVYIETTDCFPSAQNAPKVVEAVWIGAMRNIMLNIRHPNKYQKSNSSNQCHFRSVAKVTNTNSEQYQVEQLNYNEALQDMWSLPWDMKPVDNSEQIYQSAGLILNSSHYLAHVQLDSACPEMIISTDSYPSKSDFNRRALISLKKKPEPVAKAYSYDAYQPQWILSSVNGTTDESGQLLNQFKTRIPADVNSFGLQVYCTTARSGLWTSEYLKIEKPWILRSRLLNEENIVQNEIVSFQVMVEISKTAPCGQIDLFFDGLGKQFTSVTASNVTLCLCPRQQHLITFRKIVHNHGPVNLTSTTTLVPYSAMCRGASSSVSATNKSIESLSAEITSTEIYAIYVEPQGFKQTRHVRALICSDTDTTFKIQVNLMAHPGLWSLKDAIGPVQYKITCSLNMFWEILNRLHDTGIYDIDTGEQLALNLLSSGILHAYLRNHRVAKVDPLGRQAAGLRRKQYYLSQQISRFQHRDGSISVYEQKDKKGSVWLTALILRGLTWTAQAGLYPDYSLISKLLQFLEKRIDILSGCFEETGSPLPFVLHGAKGQLNRELHKLMLTAYVFIALNENSALEVFPHDKAIQSRVGELTKKATYCLFQSYPGEGPRIDFAKLSNLAIAMLTYAFNLVPELWEKVGINCMSVLYKRLTTSIGSSGNITYLADTTELDSPQFETSPVAIEATAYYATLMSLLNKDLTKQIEVIKYLVTYHDFYPTSRLIHSTVMVIRALSNFANEHLDPYGSATVALGCFLQFRPLQVRKSIWLSYPDKHLVKWSPVEALNATDLFEMTWEAKNLIPQQCVLAQAKLTYLLPYDDPFVHFMSKFRVYVRKVKATKCVEPTAEICIGINIKDGSFNPSMPLDTGTLVIELWPPSNFAPKKENLVRQFENNRDDMNRRRPRLMEVGRNNELMFLFEGWTEEEARAELTLTELRRCVKVPFYQVYHSERSRPLLIKGYDLHRLYSVSQTTWIFPDCLPMDGMDERADLLEAYNPVSETPCPVCSSNLQNVKQQLENLFNSPISVDILLFRSHEYFFRFGKPVILYTTRSVNHSSYWLTLVNLPNQGCRCPISTKHRFAIACTDVKFDYSSVDSVFDFKVFGYTNEIYFVSFDDPSSVLAYFSYIFTDPGQCFPCLNLMKLLNRKWD